MYNKKITYNNKQLTRINRKKAINILTNPKKHDGIIVYFLPVNADPKSPWINGFEYLTMDFNSMDAVDNINYLNEYMFYNCVEDLGKYLKFYIEEDR